MGSLLERIKSLFTNSRPSAVRYCAPPKVAPVPCDSQRWVFELDGFESFLFTRVKLPTLGATVKTFTVWLHNPVSSKVNEQLAQWMNDAKPRRGCFKRLDAVGDVVETWSFEELRPIYVDVGVNYPDSSDSDLKPFDYDQSGMVMISRLVLGCSTPTVS